MYFDKFPFVEYKGQKVRNIAKACKLTEEIKAYETLFLPYTLQFNERAENLAYDYYGNPAYYWLVLYSNNVQDPYNDWYKDDNTFQEDIITKYGSLSNAATNVEYYKVNADGAYDDIVVSKDTVELDPTSVTEPEPVTSYDLELDKNDSKRKVLLLSNDLAANASSLLEKLLNE